MLRVVVDTNVLVSALLKPASAPGVLLARWTQDRAFEVLLSVANLEELRRVVRYPAIRKRIKMSDDELGLRIDMIDTLSTPVEAGRAGAGRVRDPEDEAVLHTAVEGRADFIVTGDDDLLTLVQFEGIPIMKPRAFLGLLDRRSGQAGSVHDRSPDAVYRARATASAARRRAGRGK